MLAIGTVHPGTVDAAYLSSLVATLSEDPRGRELHGRGRVILKPAPAGMIHVARNAVVTAFLQHPQRCSHLLFIDADMTWMPADVWALVAAAEAHDLPVVGALVAMADGVPVLYDEAFQTLAPVPDSLQRVFCAGMAFMLLRRDVLEQCAAVYSWPCPWFDYGTRQGQAVSEDVIFAQRLADLQIPIRVDTRITVGHRKVQTVRVATEVAA